MIREYERKLHVVGWKEGKRREGVKEGEERTVHPLVNVLEHQLGHGSVGVDLRKKQRLVLLRQALVLILLLLFHYHLSLPLLLLLPVLLLLLFSLLPFLHHFLRTHQRDRFCIHLSFIVGGKTVAVLRRVLLAPLEEVVSMV